MTDIESLIDRSFAAKEHSYNAYSHFRVGAALLCEDGTVFTGTNVENASYSMAICAERAAMVSAVSQGQRHFKQIVISSDLEDFIYPCGACRQFISEFGPDIEVVVTKKDRSRLSYSISQLLPFAFRPQCLLSHTSAAKNATH